MNCKPDNTAYQQSIAAEFHAIKDRVRYFIGDRHWGEDGRYKEVILMNFLRRILPNSIAVGTGFVKNSRNQLTGQIDIIVYRKDFPMLFSEGDFVVVMPESVIGIIEVKSKFHKNTLTKRPTIGRNPCSPLEKCQRNGKIIGNANVFNGLFAYESEVVIDEDTKQSPLAEQLKTPPCFINHICFGEDKFCKYWDDGNPHGTSQHARRYFRFYDLSSTRITGHDGGGLAYGYFFSNLLETVYRLTNPIALNNQYFEFLYPIEGGKESYRMMDCDIEMGNE